MVENPLQIGFAIVDDGRAELAGYFSSVTEQRPSKIPERERLKRPSTAKTGPLKALKIEGRVI